MSDASQLIYVHDPMCSWCWGFRPVLETLVSRLEPEIPVSRLLGGLAPDSDQDMPQDMQQYLQQTWRQIQQRIPGTAFNFDFWQRCKPRRSTWPACRAVIAARQLDPSAEDSMIRAIQYAYYVEARNPSDTQTLIALADKLGLDVAQFASLIDATSTQATLQSEMAAARRMGADSFPSLRFLHKGRHWPITVDYLHAESMLEDVDRIRRER